MIARDRALDEAQSPRRAASEKGADAEDQRDRRRQRHRHHLQQRVFEFVNFAKVAPEHQHAAVGAAARDDQRLL